jgi:hypothetical protein
MDFLAPLLLAVLFVVFGLSHRGRSGCGGCSDATTCRGRPGCPQHREDLPH